MRAANGNGGGVLLATASVLAVGLLTPGRTPRIHRRRGRKGQASIAVLERVRVGDAEQSVLVRSEDTNNPVLLYLHGGWVLPS